MSSKWEAVEINSLQVYAGGFMYPNIDLYFIQIPIYTVLFLAAFAVAIVIARHIAPGYGIPKEDVLYASCYGAIGLFIGAKVMYFVSKLPIIVTRFDVYIAYFKKDIMGALNFSFGGLVFYGGLIGAVVGVYIYCRQYKVPFYPFLDIFAPLIPFVHGFGRIGCFFAGCCYGKEYHGFGSVQFRHNDLIPELDDVPRVPVQLIEAGLNFILCIILFVVMKKVKTKTGQMMGIYVLSYLVIRICTECLRGDSVRGGIGVLSTSQIVSLILIPIGIVLVRGKYIEQKKG